MDRLQWRFPDFHFLPIAGLSLAPLPQSPCASPEEETFQQHYITPKPQQCSTIKNNNHHKGELHLQVLLVLDQIGRGPSWDLALAEDAGDETHLQVLFSDCDKF